MNTSLTSQEKKKAWASFTFVAARLVRRTIAAVFLAAAVAFPGRVIYLNTGAAPWDLLIVLVCTIITAMGFIQLALWIAEEEQ